MKRSQLSLLLACFTGVFLPVVYAYITRPNPDVIHLYNSSEKFTQEINHKIPFGTDIRAARLLLIKSGLRCRLYPAEVDATEKQFRNAEQRARKRQLSSLQAIRREDKIIDRAWYADITFKYGKCLSIKTSFSQSKPFLD